MTFGIYIGLLLAGGVGLSSDVEAIRLVSPYIMFMAMFVVVIYFIATNSSKIITAIRPPHKVI